MVLLQPIGFPENLVCVGRAARCCVRDAQGGEGSGEVGPVAVGVGLGQLAVDGGRFLAENLDAATVALYAPARAELSRFTAD